MRNLGIITVTYNSQAVINGFMNSLLSQTYSNWHLYVVDSGSNDDTLNEIKKIPHNNQVTILALNENVGFAKGNNIAIKRAIDDACDELLLINNDTLFASDFLAKLVLEREVYPNTVLAPKMYATDGQHIWAAGGGFKPHNAWAAYHCGDGELDTGQYDKDIICSFVPMCCVLIPLDIWRVVGELDEKYFIYSEDADWFYRALQKNIKSVYCYKPEIIHKVSSLTGGTKSKNGASFGTRNRVYFICKHFRGWTKYRYLSKYFIGMFISLLLGKYSWQEFKWRLPAFFDGLKIK